MKTLLSLAILTSLTGVAAAETFEQIPSPARPVDGYFALGGVIGAQRAIHLGGALEVGSRVQHSPLFVRAQLAGGDSGLLTEGGSFVQLRGGVEVRGCIARELLCGFTGADLGYQHEKAVTYEYVIDGDLMTTDAHDLLVVPRVGYELGRTVKLRASLELPLYNRLDQRERGYAVAGTFGIGFGF